MLAVQIFWGIVGVLYIVFIVKLILWAFEVEKGKNGRSHTNQLMSKPKPRNSGY